MGSDLFLVLAFDECGVKGLRAEEGGEYIIHVPHQTMCPYLASTVNSSSSLMALFRAAFRLGATDGYS